MTDELLEQYVRQHIEAQHAPEVTFAWQGGEPTLMGLDFFRRAVELQRKYRQPGMRDPQRAPDQRHALDDEWCRVLRARTASWSASASTARAELHDAYRVDKAARRPSTG